MKEKWWVEVYGGYGLGHATAFGYEYFLFTGDVYDVSGNYQKFYVQPSVGFKADELISNFSLKCSLIDFTKLTFLIDGVEVTPSTKAKLFIAPVATLKFPMITESLYGTVQVGLNMATGGEPVFDYEPLMLSAGLIFQIKPKN
jgi:hypothetical protein